MSSKKTCILLLLGISLLLVANFASAAEEDYYYDWETTDDAWWAVLPFFSLGLICWVPMFIIWLVILVWVYKDAEKRGANGALWVIIVFFLSIIGLIIYLVVRPSGNQNQPTGGYAPPPAQSNASNDRRCPNCGRGIPMDANVCPYCGKRFEQN